MSTDCLRAGANSGIGREVALQCASRGAKLVLGCRSASKAEAVSAYIKRKTGNDKVYCVMVDLASLSSVRQLVDVCCQRQWTIDVLINNAGLSCLIPLNCIIYFEKVICFRTLNIPLLLLLASARRYCDPSCLFVGSFVRLLTFWGRISQKPLEIDARFRQEMVYRESNGHAIEIQDAGLSEVCTLCLLFLAVI